MDTVFLRARMPDACDPDKLKNGTGRNGRSGGRYPAHTHWLGRWDVEGCSKIADQREGAGRHGIQ